MELCINVHSTKEGINEYWVIGLIAHTMYEVTTNTLMTLGYLLIQHISAVNHTLFLQHISTPLQLEPVNHTQFLSVIST